MKVAIRFGVTFCKGNPPQEPFLRSFPTESDPFPVVPSSFRPDSIRVYRTLYAFLLFVRGSIVRVIPLPDIGSIGIPMFAFSQ